MLFQFCALKTVFIQNFYKDSFIVCIVNFYPYLWMYEWLMNDFCEDEILWHECP